MLSYCNITTLALIILSASITFGNENTRVYHPTSIIDITGTHSSEQPLSVLAVRDQSGGEDNWEKYVKFSSQRVYSGVLKFRYISALLQLNTQYISYVHKPYH